MIETTMDLFFGGKDLEREKERERKEKEGWEKEDGCHVDVVEELEEMEHDELIFHLIWRVLGALGCMVGVIIACVILGFLCGCKSHAVLSERNTSVDSVVITSVDTVIRDRLVAVSTKEDSAWMKAWLECDSSGQVMMRYAEVLNGRNDRLEWQLDSLGKLKVRSVVERDTIYVPVHDTTIVKDKDSRYRESDIEIYKKDDESDGVWWWIGIGAAMMLLGVWFVKK